MSKNLWTTCHWRLDLQQVGEFKTRLQSLPTPLEKDTKYLRFSATRNLAAANNLMDQLDNCAPFTT